MAKKVGKPNIVKQKAESRIVGNATSKSSEAKFSSLSQSQLRAKLKEYGLRFEGRKDQLVRRLEKWDRGHLQASTMADESATRLRHDSVHLNGRANDRSRELEVRLLEKREREAIVLWRHPITTLHYFIRELVIKAHDLIISLWHNKLIVMISLAILAAAAIAYQTPGDHQQMVQRVEKQILWCLYWVGLGVLSSVGLGTGLHTFLLYLGPHIAAVTLAAYECNSLAFPEPPYPDEIICPEDDTGSSVISIWTIMSKVRLEAFMWGAGTALGELPPYFMARAARLSGYDPDDDELEEFEELQEKVKEHPEDMSLLDRAKLGVERLVERVGFFGILACASIPNPLFDLAGITCGHFLVPFWTFFGATLIGKAIVKMHLQKLFVIIAFNESLVEAAVESLGALPYIGSKLQAPFEDFLLKQKEKLHRKLGSADTTADSGNLLARCFEVFVLVMIVYFIISIINSMAQSYHKRKHRGEKLAVD